MEDLNDIIASLSADDINMLKGVASSILGDANDDSQQSSNNNSGNNNNNTSHSNNNTQFNNSNSNNSIQSTINNLLNGNLSVNQNNNQNNQQQNALNLNSLGLNSDDFKMMMKAKTIFDKMNNTNDKNTDLILALKPHLSPENRNKADTAIKILRLFDILPMLKDLF